LKPIRTEHPYMHVHTFTTMDARTYTKPMSLMSTSELVDLDLKIDKVAACVSLSTLFSTKNYFVFIRYSHTKLGFNSDAWAQSLHLPYEFEKTGRVSYHVSLCQKACLVPLCCTASMRLVANQMPTRQVVGVYCAIMHA
jgi:hypothetical protein